MSTSAYSPSLKSARTTSTWQDGEWYSKIAAADAAWHIQARLRGAPEAVGSRIAEALGAAVKDKDWAVRKSAVVAMAALVNKNEALPALLSRYRVAAQIQTMLPTLTLCKS